MQIAVAQRQIQFQIRLKRISRDLRALSDSSIAWKEEFRSARASPRCLTSKSSDGLFGQRRGRRETVARYDTLYASEPAWRQVGVRRLVHHEQVHDQVRHVGLPAPKAREKEATQKLKNQPLQFAQSVRQQIRQQLAVKSGLQRSTNHCTNLPGRA